MFGALLAALTRDQPLRPCRGSSPPAWTWAPPSGDPRASTFQRAVRADPDSAAAYAGLGDAYLQRARETGDPSLLLARRPRRSAPALRRDPRELGALIGAGTLAGLRHDFREQLRLGTRGAPRSPPTSRGR